MQQQLEVTHIETLNALTTTKLAVTLITDSNYEYFLDETPKPVLQGYTDLSHETLPSSLLLTVCGISGCLPWA